MNEIHVIYGDKPLEMTKELLHNLNLKDRINKGMLIGIKPNLVLAKTSQTGATTSPEIVEGIIQYLKKYDYHKIVILESSWIGGSTRQSFQVCGYERLKHKYNIPLIDLKEDRVIEADVGEFKIKVCKKMREIDFLINVPVLKAHCQTKFTCALKNLKGCIPDSEKRRFHTLGLHKPIAYLNKIIPSDLVIVDAIIGDLTFEEGGNPVRMNRIIAGEDPVLVDTYGAELIGYKKDEIEYLQIAEKIGVGSFELKKAVIREYNTGQKSGQKYEYSRKAMKLTQNVSPKEACSACYGSLIHALQRLDDRGKLNSLDKVHIGQGYRGKKIDGIGIGNCTSGFSYFLKGCPPSAIDIISFLEKIAN